MGGYVKSMVCANKPQTLVALKNKMDRAIDEVRLEMLETGVKIEDVTTISRGGHMPELIFKS